MIVGKGDIAGIINDREGAIFFVSGVSNSRETRQEEFQREVDLLLTMDTSLCLFYFSSINIDRKDLRENLYLKHKLKMENLIKARFRFYNIIRVGNISWGSNPNTFINYIRNAINEGKDVEIKHEYKFVIDMEQVQLLTDFLPLNGRNQISVFGRMGVVRDFIDLDNK